MIEITIKDDKTPTPLFVGRVDSVEIKRLGDGAVIIRLDPRPPASGAASSVKYEGFGDARKADEGDSAREASAAP